jgi:uncharacterized membrane protein YbhN (UPF0104 family)/membrane-associated phospholipid phosphatase
VTWIRDTDEKASRRPSDIALLAVSAVLALLVGFWAQTESNVNLNLFRTLNDLSGNMVGLAKGVYALGSIWAVLAVTAVLLLLRQFRVAVYVVLAGAGAWGLALLLNELLGVHTITGLDVAVRIGDGPVYPVANVAAITALAFGIAPFVVRPLRRILALVILLVCAAAMYLGAGFPADVIGGVLVGFGVAAAVRVLFGAPGGQPSVAEVRAALTDLGYDIASIAPADESIQRAAVMDVDLATGEHLRVDAFGRDQRDARIVAKLWHKAMYRDPGLAVFGSRVQQVEHIAYTLMLAERAVVPAARLVRTGVGGADAAVLVTMPPRGTPIGSLPVERVTDTVLHDAWKQLDALHHAGVAHGTIDGLRVVVDDGSVAFDDFSASDASGEDYWRNRDDASLLVLTAQVVGHDRAIAAMVGAIGKERAGKVIPVVQPAALPSGLTKGVKHQGKDLKTLREALATATGAEDVPPLKIKRLSLLNIGMLIGVLFAVAIAFHSMEGINWSSVKGEFENATWAWAFLALVLYPLVPTSWATALMGCVNKDLPFVPTVLTQLACSFLNLITPNGIGGTALQIDYLHKQDVPVASAGSAMVLSTGVGGAIQMILFLGAAAITATAVDTGSSSDSSSSNALLIIAIVAALVGVVLFIPKVKNKVIPAVKRAATDIWAVVRNPKKALMLVGGDTGGNLIYPLILGVCMLAFNQHLDFAQLVVVQVGAGMVGNVAPVPGGIGVTEAALTAGLTSFGIAPAPALASVLLFRGITFLLPPIFGFFTLRWLRAKGYA